MPATIVGQMATVAVIAICLSALALAIWPIFPVVMASRVAHAAASCVLGPVMVVLVRSLPQFGATSQYPAGWHPDPGGSGRQRYWDGQQWTDHVHDPFAGQGQPGGVVSPGRADGTQPTDTAASDRKIPRFGARKAAEGLQAELAVAHASLEKLGALDHAQIRLAIAEQRALLGQISEQVRQQQFALEHAKGEILVNGRCMPKVCPPGQQLRPDGTCHWIGNCRPGEVVVNVE